MVRILFFERYVRILTYLIEGYVKGVKGTEKNLTVAHAKTCSITSIIKALKYYIITKKSPQAVHKSQTYKV